MSSDKGEKKCTSGDRLREERERIGLSQTEFGKKLDTTKRTVVNWESEKTFPDVYDLSVMNYVLGVDTNYIITGVRSDANIVKKIPPHFHNDDLSVVMKAFNNGDAAERNALLAVANLVHARTGKNK